MASLPDPEQRSSIIPARPSYVRQFVTGASGEAFSQVVTIGTQLLLIPVLLLLWGQERLGVWLILSAVPSYLTLGDLGLTSIFGNEITRRQLAGEEDGAIVAVHSSWLTTHVITAAAVFLSIILAWLAPGFVPRVDSISQTDAQLALVLMCLGVCMLLAQGTVYAGMRAVGLAGVSSGVNAAARLAENAALLVTAALSDKLAVAALAMLAARVSVLVSCRMIFLRRYPIFRSRIRRADRSLIWQLMPASAGYFSFTFGNAALIQLPAIIIGNLISPGAVVVFTAARTLSRMGRMLVSIVNNAIDPIYTQLAGHAPRSLHETARLHRLGVLAFTLAYFVISAVVGPAFLRIWTHGATEGHEVIYFILLGAVAAEIYWFTLQVPYLSTNQHYMFGYAYAVLAVGTALIQAALAPSFGLIGVAVAILGCHCLFGIYTLAQTKRRPLHPEPRTP